MKNLLKKCASCLYIFEQDYQRNESQGTSIVISESMEKKNINQSSDQQKKQLSLKQSESQKQQLQKLIREFKQTLIEQDFASPNDVPCTYSVHLSSEYPSKLSTILEQSSAQEVSQSNYFHKMIRSELDLQSQTNKMNNSQMEIKEEKAFQIPVAQYFNYLLLITYLIKLSYLLLKFFQMFISFPFFLLFNLLSGK